MISSPKIWRLMIIGIALGVFALGISTGCKKKTPPPPPPPPTPTPVIPPGSVVMVQRGHLVRLDLETSQSTPLTGGKSTEWFPVCSPNGDQVIYWSNAEGGIYNLWRINLDGTQRTQLTFDETNSLRTGDQNLLVNAAASWSKEGKRILYAVEGNIWAMDSDGYNPETLLNGHSGLCPVFSPDGKTVILISNFEDSVYNLWALTLSDKTLKKLTNYTDWSVGSPSFSTDGHKILFSLYRSNITQVYTVDPDGQNPINLTNNNRSLCPRFAQNDRKVIFCSYGMGDEETDLNVYLMNANGSDANTAKALTTDGGTSPSWAPARILTILPTPVGK